MTIDYELIARDLLASCSLVAGEILATLAADEPIALLTDVAIREAVHAELNRRSEADLIGIECQHSEGLCLRLDRNGKRLYYMGCTACGSFMPGVIPSEARLHAKMMPTGQSESRDTSSTCALRVGWRYEKMSWNEMVTCVRRATTGQILMFIIFRMITSGMSRWASWLRCAGDATTISTAIRAGNGRT